jgi:hypothetical protein
MYLKFNAAPGSYSPDANADLFETLSYKMGMRNPMLVLLPESGVVPHLLFLAKFESIDQPWIAGMSGFPFTRLTVAWFEDSLDKSIFEMLGRVSQDIDLTDIVCIQQDYNDEWSNDIAKIEARFHEIVPMGKYLYGRIPVGISTDEDPRTIAPDVRHFLALVEQVPWFSNLGKPTALDQGVGRIKDWSQWAGPEGGFGYWYGRWPAVVREHIEKDEQSRMPELKDLWDKIHAVAMDKASSNMPLYDAKQDPWYGPTCCVLDAAYTAALVGWHIYLTRPIPKIIAENWRWFADGHWPCDFAEDPVGLDERIDLVPVVKFLVF